jgi:hypothetical protein
MSCMRVDVANQRARGAGRPRRTGDYGRTLAGRSRKKGTDLISTGITKAMVSSFYHEMHELGIWLVIICEFLPMLDY